MDTIKLDTIQLFTTNVKLNTIYLSMDTVMLTIINYMKRKQLILFKKISFFYIFIYCSLIAFTMFTKFNWN